MSAWIGHVPFGMYLIDLLRPKALAELGTHFGVSYCALCQAVKELGLETRCYAIDTWEGDVQAGFYGPEVLANLEEHHNPAYGSFSQLVQSTFDEALNHFADDTFDLLHIDGFHTYEAVKADFEKWLPKMSDRGVILFHDINVRERDFGVWKFWDELKLQYAHFEFVHSHGLGVLAVGHDYPKELNALLHCSEVETMNVRRFFSTLGARLEALQDLQAVKLEREAYKTQTHRLDAHTQSLNDQMQTISTLTQTQNAQLTETTQQVSALTAQLQEREVQIREKEFELIASKDQQEDLTRQQEELQAELQRRISELDELIREKDSQLLSAINLAEKNQLKLRAQTQQIIGLRQDLNLRDVKGEKDQQELQAQAFEITKLKQDLEDRGVKLQSAALQIRSWERRTQELAHLLTGIEHIRSTGSYRFMRALSAPLRIGKRYRKRLARLVNRVNGPSVNQRPSLESPKEITQASEPATNTPIADSQLTPTSESDSQTEDSADAEWNINDELWVYTNVATRETALFDTAWYLHENPDVAEAKVDPLTHFLRWGATEGRAPHPLFDPKFYMTSNPEAAIGSGTNALKHYLTEGWTKGYKPNPTFDPAFYLAENPDVAEVGMDPLTHFVTNGFREGRATYLKNVYLEPFEADFEISRQPTQVASTIQSDVKAIALYLPQFHPIPENDEWWGTGFTEWTNVRRGKPQFKDHYQPHVPSELGYYDLRESDVLERQAALAQEYGIYGFCFYYYWFVGKILLDLPIRRMLERGKPDIPFCICWANENWTRRWDGQENEILIGQKHSAEDDLAFLQNIESILLHKNYITVEGKPLLIVYQPSILPDALATAVRWREAFRDQGNGEIFLAAMQTFAHQTPPQEYGFDAVIQFPPHAHCAPVTSLAQELDKSFSGLIYDYNPTKWTFIDELYQLHSSRRIYPGVMPSWDNTARRRTKANIWINSSPESYYDWLWQAASFLRTTKPDDDKFVFINAWNEWAEGCHLEPDQSFGYAWLNATRLALQPEGAPD